MAEQKEETSLGGSCCINPKNVEIERKFAVYTDTEGKIVQAGGTCVKDVTFSDSYFDTDSFHLTLVDRWLRRRDGKWELKAPLSEPSKQNIATTCTKYLEITDEHGILEHLSAILLTSANELLSHCSELLQTEVDLSLDEWLRRHNLKPFAEFTTHRKSYSMDGDVSIELDETNFGSSVGEIEMMTGLSGSDVAAAVARIDEIAEKIGQEMPLVVKNLECVCFMKQNYDLG